MTKETIMPLDNPVIFFIFVALVLVFMSLRIVKEYDRGVIFFLGKVTGVRGPGLIILIPILEQMTKVTHSPIIMNILSLKIIKKVKVYRERNHYECISIPV